MSESESRFLHPIEREIRAIEGNDFTVFGELVLPLRGNDDDGRPALRLSAAPTVLNQQVSLPSKHSYGPIYDKAHFVWWDRITIDSVDALQGGLDKGAGERELHRIIESHPTLLVQGMKSGHGGWVYPRGHLSVHHEIDFLLAEQHSMGFCKISLKAFKENQCNNKKRIGALFQEIPHGKI